MSVRVRDLCCVRVPPPIEIVAHVAESAYAD